MKVSVPFPPSLNHLYRRVGARTLISREGRRYRERIRGLLMAARLSPATSTFRGRVHMTVTLHPPDRKRRDLDNSMKALLDALEHAGVYADDSQIDELKIVRGAIVHGGSCDIEITEER
jgi:crossover junction endodeoxyribonuclease RusA